jgi:YidC/Oxa1 family membrane protein insertase
MILEFVVNPLAPAVSLAHSALLSLVPLLTPLLGAASVAGAIVLLTLVVRAALVPLSIRIVRAERARLALAPVLDRLRRKHSADPARLLREVQAVHREAGVGQFAGLLPALAQAPFLMVIYRLCTAGVIAGGSNIVLSANLFGAPLAQGGVAIVSSAGVLSPPALVFACVIALMCAVAFWSSSVAVARFRTAGGSGAGSPEAPVMQLALARIMPFGAVAAALAVPLAVSIYLLTSMTWAVAERAVLPHLV